MAEDSMLVNKVPTRSELRLILIELCAGRGNREEISNWAFSFYNDDLLEISDPIVQYTLESLVLVDSISTDRPYLYTTEDFEKWIDKLDHNL